MSYSEFPQLTNEREPTCLHEGADSLAERARHDDRVEGLGLSLRQPSVAVPRDYRNLSQRIQTITLQNQSAQQRCGGGHYVAQLQRS